MPEKSPARQLGEDAWRRKYNRIHRILARGRIRWDGASRYIRTRIRGFSDGKRKREGGLIFLYAFSLLLSWLFNIYLFRPDESCAVSWTGWVSSGLLLAWLLLLACKYRWLGYLILPVILLTNLVTYYIFSVFGSYIDFQIIASILETDTQEALPYISWKNILLVLSVLLVPLLGVHYGHKYLAVRIGWKQILAGAALFGLSLPFFQASVKELDTGKISTGYYSSAAWWPVIDIRMNYKRVKEYIKKGGKQFHAIMRLPSMTDQPSRCLLPPEEEIIVLLHVGESLRADHLQINGYARPTTPCLARRIRNLVSFPDCHSFGLVTRVSLIGMLTDAEVRNRSPRHASFLDMFNKHGYETGAVLSRPASIHDFPLEILTSSLNRKSYIPSIPGIESYFGWTIWKVLEMEGAMRGKRKFILFYDSGAHPFFHSLNRNKKWLPDEYPENAPLKHLSAVVNAYDNNLVEIDLEIEGILKALEHKNAVFIHIGDHGVALGENGQFGQANLTEPVKKPSFFIWMSDQFIQKHEEKFRNVKLHADKPVSHDYLLYTVLSLGGIETSLNKKELDLTGKDALPFVAPKDEKILMEGQKNSWK